MTPKTPQEIKIMRNAGKLLAKMLSELAREVQPGKNPKDIANLAAEKIKAAGLTPIVLGYEGFSDVICISVNQAIVHGVPSSEAFKEGDVVKLDLTLASKGLVVDSAITVVAGDKEPPSDTKRLLEGTRRALEDAIAAIHGDGTRVGDISAAAQSTLEKYELGIIRDLVGHGVGHGIHKPPNVPNYGVAGTGPVLHADRKSVV